MVRFSARYTIYEWVILLNWRHRTYTPCVPALISNAVRTPADAAYLPAGKKAVAAREFLRIMEKEIKTILVDDETGCIDNLKHYLAVHCPGLKVIATAGNPAEAAQLFATRSVDLAFLDVHLFDENIFDFLPAMARKDVPMVFVTAYDSYAMKAFRVSALDYLLKPLETTEVIRCYEKIRRYFSGVIAPAKLSRIMLKQGEQVYFVHPDEFILLKAQGFYTTVSFEYEGRLRHMIMSKPISQLCEEWNIPSLVRVHRSYAINMKKVTRIRKYGSQVNLELGSDLLIPVAKSRVADFFERYDV